MAAAKATQAEAQISRLTAARFTGSDALDNATLWQAQQRRQISRPITLAKAGTDKHLADRARKYAAIPETKFEGVLADHRERIEQEDARVSINLLDDSSIQGRRAQAVRNYDPCPYDKQPEYNDCRFPAGVVIVGWTDFIM
jgi:hypothetical protein